MSGKEWEPLHQSILFGSIWCSSNVIQLVAQIFAFVTSLVYHVVLTLKWCRLILIKWEDIHYMLWSPIVSSSDIKTRLHQLSIVITINHAISIDKPNSTNQTNSPLTTLTSNSDGSNYHLNTFTARVNHWDTTYTNIRRESITTHNTTHINTHINNTNIITTSTFSHSIPTWPEHTTRSSSSPAMHLCRCRFVSTWIPKMDQWLSKCHSPLCLCI